MSSCEQAGHSAKIFSIPHISFVVSFHAERLGKKRSLFPVGRVSVIHWKVHILSATVNETKLNGYIAPQNCL